MTSNDQHSKTLASLDSKVRTSLFMMIYRAEKGIQVDKLDSLIRSIRRRYDELVPPNSPDRKAFEPGLIKKRAAWDAWFHRFVSGADVTIDDVNFHVDSVNDAKRLGVPDSEPIKKFDEYVIITEIKKIDTRTKEEIEIEELEEKITSLRAKKGNRNSDASKSKPVDLSRIPKLPVHQAPSVDLSRIPKVPETRNQSSKPETHQVSDQSRVPPPPPAPTDEDQNGEDTRQVE